MFIYILPIYTYIHKKRSKNKLDCEHWNRRYTNMHTYISKYIYRYMGKYIDLYLYSSYVFYKYKNYIERIYLYMYSPYIYIYTQKKIKYINLIASIGIGASSEQTSH